MNIWVLSANPNYFNHKAAFCELGYIDWKQTRKFSVGDLVYIYVTKPISQIQYKTQVIISDMNENEICDLSEYWIKEKTSTAKNIRYARLKLLREYKDDRLSFDYLKHHGMQYAPQSPCRVNKQLQEYIELVEVKVDG